MNNRQLRVWVFMLYPDNPKHCAAINYIDLLDNAVYIQHVEKKSEEGNLINKAHWHCVMKFDPSIWLSKLLKDLGLDEEDAHLFHSYTDFKIGKKQRFRSLNEYYDYLDHIKDDSKPDKYSPNDFHGGLKKEVLKVINSRELNNSLALLDLSDFIRNYQLDHFTDTRFWSFTDWYKLCYENGYGDTFYKEWFKMRDILSAYIYK